METNKCRLSLIRETSKKGEYARLSKNRLNYYKKTWGYYTSGIALGIGVISYFIVPTLHFNYSFVRWNAIFLSFSSLLCLFIASKVTVYKHKFGTHPSSFIAQTQVFGKKNTKALVIFNIWVVLLISLNILWINFLDDYLNALISIELLFIANIGATMSIAWMAAVPINISRFGHLSGVLGMFVFYTFENVLFAIFFMRNIALYSNLSFWYAYPAFIELFFSFIYMCAYFNDLRKKVPPSYFKPGLWQKFWIITFTVSQMIYLFIFTAENVQFLL